MHLPFSKTVCGFLYFSEYRMGVRFLAGVILSRTSLLLLIDLADKWL